MRYTVYIERGAEKDIGRLPSRVSDKVDERILLLGTEPRPRGCRKVGFALYRIIVGDYRIVYSVDDGEKEVRIWIVRHRRDVYRRVCSLFR